MKRMAVASLSLALALGLTGAAMSSEATSKTKKPTSTTARVSLSSARSTALAKVPGAKVKSEELEREHGKLIYSFDLEVAGKSGIQEVQIDAMTGKVVSSKHETPSMERKEKANEKSKTK